MQISGFRHSAYTPQPRTSSPQAGNPFEQALADINVKDSVSITSTSSASAQSTSGAGETPDYTSMTPQQFDDAGKKLYKDGKIDLDQLFKIHFATGIFDGRDNPASQVTAKTNYVDHFQQQLKLGSQIYGAYGYHKIEDLVKVLTS